MYEAKAKITNRRNEISKGLEFKIHAHCTGSILHYLYTYRKGDITWRTWRELGNRLDLLGVSNDNRPTQRWGVRRMHVWQSGKVHPRICHEGPEGEYRYSSTLSLTSSLDGVGGERHAPVALPPGNTRYPLYRRLGGPKNRSGRVGISRPTGIRFPEPSSP